MTPKRHFEINWPLAVWLIVFTLVSETIYSGINHTPPSMTINTKCLPFLWLCHTWVTDPELVTVIIIADDVVNAIESEMQSIVEQRAERHPLTAIKYRAIRNGEQGGNRPPPYFRKNNICMTIYYCLPLNPVPSPYISRPSNGPEVVQVWGTFLNSMLSKAGAKLAEYTASFS